MRKIIILAIITMLNLANGAELQGKYGCNVTNCNRGI